MQQETKEEVPETMSFTSKSAAAARPAFTPGLYRYSIRRKLVFLAVACWVLPALSQPFVAAASPSKAQAAPAAQPRATFASEAFERTWLRNDRLVAAKSVARSWTWGPSPLASGLEAYADAPDGTGKRLVQYFDKSRMEVNDPSLAPGNPWYVTNGLLTVELISGQMQTGNAAFEARGPAAIPLASDADDANAPTYASFGTVANTSAGAKRQADRTRDGYATGRINKQGTVTDDPAKAALPEARIAYYDATSGHNVPRVFWDFLNGTGAVQAGIASAEARLFDPWIFAMGLPISDAYWASVKIEGRVQEVLIQAFERRVLTYAPGLPKGWQVQMGNIGQHYYEWRYGPGNARPLEAPRRATPGAPAYLSIPTLGVLAKVEHVGVDKDNNMDVPSDAFNVGWFKPGTVPGNVGNAVIDGHFDYYGIRQAVFYNLSKLKPGDRVYVRDERGQERGFAVTRLMECIYNKCPQLEVFGPANVARLNLITCAGKYDRATQNYDKRTVIFTEALP